IPSQRMCAKRCVGVQRTATYERLRQGNCAFFRLRSSVLHPQLLLPSGLAMTSAYEKIASQEQLYESGLNRAVENRKQARASSRYQAPNQARNRLTVATMRNEKLSSKRLFFPSNMVQFSSSFVLRS